MVDPPEDKMLCNLKLMLLTPWPTNFLQSEDLYEAHPMVFYDTEPLTHEDARITVVQRNEDSGKTDGCEEGCWRIIGRDKAVKLNGKVAGFKKVYKFCARPDLRRSKTWVMEEYRLIDKFEEYRRVNKWSGGIAVCKIQLMEYSQLESLLSNHIRG